MSKAVLEEWKDVKGYEGIYKISNTGKVFSVERIEIIKEKDREYKRVIGGKEIKIKKDKFGYMYVGLHKNGKRRMFKIHRLVAKEFADFPTYKIAYIKAFQNMIDYRKSLGKPTKWKSGEDCFLWWMEDENIEGQLSFDFDGNIYDDLVRNY